MSPTVAALTTSGPAGEQADTTPVPYFLTPAAEALPRTAGIRVRGQRLMIDCPVWCVVDHAAERLAFLEDLHHEGAPVQLPVPLHGGGTENVMSVRLAQWPFADQGRTYLSVDAAGDGETVGLAREAAIAFVDQLAAHVADIRCLAETLDGGRTA